MRVLLLAAAVAAANVLLARRMRLGAFVRLNLAEGAVQAFGFLVRAGLLFSTAHLVWRTGDDAREVAAFIMAAAILQLAGQAWLGNVRPRRGGQGAPAA